MQWPRAIGSRKSDRQLQWPREIRSRKSDRQYNDQEKSEAVNHTDNTMAKRNRNS